MEIPILFEDEHLLVVHKPSGISSQPEKSGEPDVTAILNKNQKELHTINRLDKRVSGLIILAKTLEMARLLNEAIQNNEIQKKYKAIVKQQPEKKTGDLIHYLIQNEKIGKSFVSDLANPKAKKAILKYKTITASTNYALLQIEIETGRFHQIRCQLAAIGSPILGDLKYGFNRSSPDGSIFLQAYHLAFTHPISQQKLSFELPIPILWSTYGF
jgi:23S rRNA pseudouridine1911/1915/1917 synthase